MRAWLLVDLQPDASPGGASSSGAVKVDRHERWECARCKHSNKIGTSVCAICKAGSAAYQRNRLNPSKPDHLPFHAENCKSLKVEQIFKMAADGVDFEERDGMAVAEI